MTKNEILLSLRFNLTNFRTRQISDKFSRDKLGYDNSIFKTLQLILKSSSVRKGSVTKVHIWVGKQSRVNGTCQRARKK